MAAPVNIPQLGIGMTEGTLVSWLVAEGDQIEAGQPLYVLETDKVEVEIEAGAGGVITLSGIEGEVYSVGSTVAEIA